MSASLEALDAEVRDLRAAVTAIRAILTELHPSTGIGVERVRQRLDQMVNPGDDGIGADQVALAMRYVQSILKS